MSEPTDVAAEAVRNLAARLANTGQVLSAWSAAVGEGSELSGRLAQASAGIAAAVEALTSKAPEQLAATHVVQTSVGGVLGLRGRSEMIELVEFIGFVSGLGFDGVLEISAADIHYLIELRNGHVVWVAADPDLEPLTAVLVDQKAVRLREMEIADAGARPGEHLGDTLRRFGLIDEASLRSALEEQAVRLFVRIHGQGSGFDFEFQERARVARGEGIRIPVSTLLLESARRVDEYQHGAERSAQERVLLERFRSGLESTIAHGELELPMLPDSTAELLSLCWSQDCDSERLALCVSGDQALCAHLLRVANSAAYAPATPISSVQLAISRLGIDRLREIALSLTLEKRVFDIDGWEEMVAELWRNSAVTSGVAGAVGKYCGAGEGRGRMIGLLQDVGKPVVLSALQQLEQKLGLELTPSVASALMEEYHGPLGARLAESWQLPDWLVEAMRFHHDHDAADRHRLEAMVGCLAAELADPAHCGEQDTSELEELPLCTELRLAAVAVRSILSDAEQLHREAS